MRRFLCLLCVLVVHALCAFAEDYEPIKVKDFPERFAFLYLAPEEQDAIKHILTTSHTERHDVLFEAYQEALYAPRRERFLLLQLLEDALHQDLVWVRAGIRYWTEVLVQLIREAISRMKQHAVDLPKDHRWERQDALLLASVIEDFSTVEYARMRVLLQAALCVRDTIQNSLDDLSLRAQHGRHPIWQK